MTVEVFDTQGNLITGDNVLGPAITISVILDGDDIGTDTIATFISSRIHFLAQWMVVFDIHPD